MTCLYTSLAIFIEGFLGIRDIVLILLDRAGLEHSILVRYSFLDSFKCNIGDRKATASGSDRLLDHRRG